MKCITILLWLLCFTTFAQESITAKLIKSTPIEENNVIDVDNFDAVYYRDNNTLYKEKHNTTINYSNIQLGNIDVVDTFNPLKILLFYKNFNTVMILDNRLAEIFKIDFNTVSPYINSSHISAGFDNTLWVFNTDVQQLQLPSV